jgi:predicted nucleotidyltransferase component of viral defense system
MKEYLAELVRSQAGPAQGWNVAKEYLQARILGGLQRSGAMIPLAFQGGTALRFLFSIPRFSEDLDFALERREAVYDLRGWLKGVEREFTAEKYGVGIKISDHRAVHSAFIRFYGLPYELGLSGQPGEAFSIKIEVDTQPPAGAGVTTTLVRRYETLQLQHHDRPSLLAGKIHALLQRPYAKGRDIYDLLWYLSDPGWPPPNRVLLRNALAQTGWADPEAAAENWRAALLERISGLNWERVQADARPFLERPEDSQLLARENLKRVLENKAW